MECLHYFESLCGTSTASLCDSWKRQDAGILRAEGSALDGAASPPGAACMHTRPAAASRQSPRSGTSATILSVTSADDTDLTTTTGSGVSRRRGGPFSFGTLPKWRAIAVVFSLVIAGGAVYLALHPVVFGRPNSVTQMTYALDGWQSALLLSLPGPDRRAGHASAELVRRIDHHADLGLQEVGTAAFATRQAAARRAVRGLIVRSSYQVINVHVVRRFWDGDLLVEATLLTSVERATYEADSGGWHSPETTDTVAPLQARLRDSLGVWRIVSVGD
jgi:hypothetical protein